MELPSHISQDRKRFLQPNVAAVLEFSQTCPEEGDDAGEVTAVVSLLGENDGDRGVHSIGKKERRPSETERSSVSMDITLDGMGACNALLFARTFGGGVRVATEVAFLGKGAVEKDAKSMEGSAVRLYVSFHGNEKRLERYLLRYYLMGRRNNTVLTWIEK